LLSGCGHAHAGVVTASPQHLAILVHGPCACVDLLQVPLASIPQFYFPGGAEPMDDEVKQQFVSNVNTLFDAHPAGLNLEQFSAVVQEVSSSMVGHGQAHKQ